MDSNPLIALISLSALFAMMTLGWVISLRKRNVTVVDSLWGLGFVLVALIAYCMGSGFEGRSRVVLLLTTIWGVRLSIYLTRRNWGKAEDHRYGQWRSNSGASFWIFSLFRVFWLQAVFLWVISLVIQKAILSPQPQQLTLLDLAGTMVWLIGFAFETVGDWQLSRFKADPANRGRVMDRGLWSWSRHPNYFGECLLWWGFFLIALSTPGGWWTVISPVIVTLVLLKMTGVPLTEAALRQRRPGYAAYMRRTSAFFPRPPRKESP